MKRVLHLFDASSSSLPYARLAMLALSMGQLEGFEEDLCLLGNRHLAMTAEQMGLPPRWRIPFAHRRAMLAYFHLKRVLRNGCYDLVHCWSDDPDALTKLAMLAAPKLPRIVSLTKSPSPHQLRWLRLLADEPAKAATICLTASHAIVKDLLTQSMNPQAVHVLYPGVDMGMVDRSQRLAIREAWGIEPNGDDRQVVAILGDPSELVDARQAHMAVGLADQVLRSRGKPLSMVVHPRQANIDWVMKACRDLNLGRFVILDEQIAKPWSILPACDIALAMGPHAGGLSLLWAMAANIPIVGEATYAISEMVEDRHSALLAKPSTPKALAHHITQLVDDPPLAWKLKDSARHEAYSLFSKQRYSQSLKMVYEQVLDGRPIEVPSLPVTGGLRFTGRA